MSEQEVFDLLFSLPSAWMYAVLFLSALIENVIPPWPGDLVTLLGAIRVGQGKLNLTLSFLSVFGGNLVGAIGMYSLGLRIRSLLIVIDEKIKRTKRSRVKNRPLQKKLSFFFFTSFRTFFSDKNLSSTQYWLSHWGLLFILFSRFSLGLRFFVSTVAGMTRVNRLLYFFVFSCAVTIFNGFLFWIGQTTALHFEEIKRILGFYGIFLLSGLLSYIIWNNRKKIRNLFRMIKGNKKSH